MRETKEVPLVVDLDGTLINSDLLLESLWALLRKNFLYVFLLPIWLCRGKHVLKFEIASRTELDVSLLPYHDALLQLVRAEAPKRRLVLATASNKLLAEKVFQFVGVFSDLLASDDNVNLSGAAKAEAIESLLGTKNFIYAGNCADDIAVWEICSKAIVVNASRKVKSTLNKKNVEMYNVFDNHKFKSHLLFKALRLHQWVKNLLILLPLLLSQTFHNTSNIVDSLIAFVIFGLCASSVYLLNDLIDIQEDRCHPSKRFRPLACGDMSLLAGSVLFPILLIISIGLALLLLPVEFFYVLTIYYLLTVSYSFYLKRKVLLDVQILSGLYTLRIIAGGAAISIELSFWLLAFSIFIFLSLALVKRCAELLLLKYEGKSVTKGRGYEVEDLGLLTVLGVCSGYLSCLVLALYINSTEILELYRSPEMLWILVPLLLYWIARIWLVTHRGGMNDDPIIFAVKDKVSILFGLTAALVVVLSMSSPL